MMELEENKIQGQVKNQSRTKLGPSQGHGQLVGPSHQSFVQPLEGPLGAYTEGS